MTQKEQQTWDECKTKAIALIQEILDATTTHIAMSNFGDNIIAILREKL
jgi:hypothetical protein